MAIIGAILFIAGAMSWRRFMLWVLLCFGLATLAVFYYLGAFWGVVWLVFWGAVFFWGAGSKDEQN